MFIEKEYIKNKTVYIYIASVLIFSLLGFFYANSKYNYSELEAIVILGDIDGRNIMPPSAVSEIITKPSFLNDNDKLKCYGSSIRNGIYLSEASYQIVSETTGFIRIKSRDLNWLDTTAAECLLVLVNSINTQEIAYLKNGRFGVHRKKIEISSLEPDAIINVTKFIGSPNVRVKPDLNNRNKYIILGFLSGLLIAYGISNWLKNK